MTVQRTAATSAFPMLRQGLAIGALLAATWVQAQPAPAPEAPAASGPMMMHRGPMGAMKDGAPGAPERRAFDPSARAKEHLARLKADLKLKPTQEAAWTAFASQADRQAETMKTRMAERQKAREAERESARGGETPSAPAQMGRHLDEMKQRLADMERMQKAVKDLYAALSPEQQKIADLHFDRLRGGRHGGHGGHGGDGHPGDGPARHGMGPMGPMGPMEHRGHGPMGQG